MSKDDDAKEIEARYRAYCDACQSGELEKVPSFWGSRFCSLLTSGSRKRCTRR